MLLLTSIDLHAESSYVLVPYMFLNPACAVPGQQLTVPGPGKSPTTLAATPCAGLACAQGQVHPQAHTLTQPPPPCVGQWQQAVTVTELIKCTQNPCNHYSRVLELELSEFKT